MPGWSHVRFSLLRACALSRRDAASPDGKACSSGNVAFPSDEAPPVLTRAVSASLADRSVFALRLFPFLGSNHMPNRLEGSRHLLHSNSVFIIAHTHAFGGNVCGNYLHRRNIAENTNDFIDTSLATDPGESEHNFLRHRDTFPQMMLPIHASLCRWETQGRIGGYEHE